MDGKEEEERGGLRYTYVGNRKKWSTKLVGQAGCIKTGVWTRS